MSTATEVIDTSYLFYICDVLVDWQEKNYCYYLILIHSKRQLKEVTELGNHGNDPLSVEKMKFIFREMFKQQGKILIETKFCFYIHQPNNIKVIDRNYKKKITTNNFV